jgi:predicted esterase YcpF (UPF0227 family)
LPESYLYIHGFNSSPASKKAQDFVTWCASHMAAVNVLVPELSHDPEEAGEQLDSIAKNTPLGLIVGSSLGGYYATWLSDKYNVPAALINPAVEPWKNYREEFLGLQTNYHTGRQYEFTSEHVDSLEAFDVEVLSCPENLLLLVQTGDEVLDYRLAVEKYQGCRQIIQDGGNHSFTGFEEILPDIVACARQVG